MKIRLLLVKYFVISIIIFFTQLINIEANDILSLKNDNISINICLNSISKIDSNDIVHFDVEFINSSDNNLIVFAEYFENNKNIDSHEQIICLGGCWEYNIGFQVPSLKLLKIEPKSTYKQQIHVVIDKSTTNSSVYEKNGLLYSNCRLVNVCFHFGWLNDKTNIISDYFNKSNSNNLYLDQIKNSDALLQLCINMTRKILVYPTCIVDN